VSTDTLIPVVAIAVVAIASIVMGALSLRWSRTTSDFLVASRSVRPSLNAAAICGEYLSAGTFLGLGGLVMVFGVDMLWYPIGYTAGYLTLMFFVAAPLRRFGAYTIPEFAEGRLRSPAVRRLCAAFVLIIGWLYLLPQMKGAGLTIRTLTGAPFWVGVVLVGAIVTGNVAIGGMRGVTFVQAFQYAIKIVAIAVPAIVLLGVSFGRGVDGHRLFDASNPVARSNLTVTLTRSGTLTTTAPIELDDGDQVRILAAGSHEVFAGQRIVLTKGQVIPTMSRAKQADGRSWLTPFTTGTSGRSHPLYAAISLMLATFLGTMGLPHILVRFYTNPDGPATRRTITVVLAMLAAYYVWPPVYGVLGRYWKAELLITGETDSVVLRLPARLVGGVMGELLTGLVAAGAFAAFLSTASGLLVSVAGALGYDLIRPARVGEVMRFRIAAIAAGIVAVVLGLSLRNFAINQLVGWAFAIAASSFCPLLVLGIWWRRLTAAGASAGMVVGGGLAVGAIGYNLFGRALSGWPGALLGQPAAWTVPIAFLTAVSVSLVTARRPSVSLTSAAVASSFALLHTPERLRRRPESAR
jgi:cation/acetate symporter